MCCSALILFSYRLMTREGPTTTMSSSAPSFPCWLRKVRGLTVASYLACPAEGHVPQVPPVSGHCWSLSRLWGSGRAVTPSAPGLRLWPIEQVAAGHLATCSRASASLQACWPTWWSRTFQCGGAKGSASVGSTSSGSLTGGNARAHTRLSASEDCWP